MACFVQSVLPYTPLLLWPAFGLLARDIAKVKGCQDITRHLLLGPFGYLNALAMPDLKSQMYLKRMTEKYSIESELHEVLVSPSKAPHQIHAR